jgi:hypothetical protein
MIENYKNLVKDDTLRGREIDTPGECSGRVFLPGYDTQWYTKGASYTVFTAEYLERHPLYRVLAPPTNMIERRIQTTERAVGEVIPVQ